MLIHGVNRDEVVTCLNGDAGVEVRVTMIVDDPGYRVAVDRVGQGVEVGSEDSWLVARAGGSAMRLRYRPGTREACTLEFEAPREWRIDWPGRRR